MGFFSSECCHCGSKEHSSGDCPHGLLSSECWHCGSKEHSTGECPHGLLSSECLHCGSNNHSSDECPHGLFGSHRSDDESSDDSSDYSHTSYSSASSAYGSDSGYSTSSSSGGSSADSGCGGCLGFLVVAIIVVVAFSALTHHSGTPTRIVSPPNSSTRHTVYTNPQSPNTPTHSYYSSSAVVKPSKPPSPPFLGPHAYPPFPAPAPGQARKQTMAGDRLYAVNVGRGDPDQLNVRAGPGERYKTVGRIPWNGSRIEYLGRTSQNGQDLWVYIRWSNVVGWVHSSHLSKTPGKQP